MFWGLSKTRQLVSILLASGLVLAASSEGQTVPLYLDVYINGQPVNLIAAFDLRSETEIYITAAELTDLGILVPSGADPDIALRLTEVAGLSYTYDQSQQRINISLNNEQRIAGQYDASNQNAYQPAQDSDLGAVLNYSLSASTVVNGDAVFSQPSLSAALEGWVYGDLGNLSTTGILRGGNYSGDPLLRLESQWQYSDPDSSITYALGDNVLGGLAWTRPVRFGGVQIKRNFALRPGFVTIPQPALSGVALGPSTIELYVGEVLVYAENVPAGPFSISNIPGITGTGDVRMVIRDNTGRETEITSLFYTSAAMLRPGLLDFSVEAGFPRLNYGIQSFDYAPDPIAAFSLRYGLTDQLTLEGHGEISADFANTGVGAVVSVADAATLTLAGAASYHDGDAGFMLHASIATKVLGLRIHASSQRTFGDYFDLATIVALAPDGVPVPVTPSFLSSISVPKAVDRITLGLPIPEFNAGLSLSYVHTDNGFNDANHLVSANYSQQFASNGALSLSILSDLDDFMAPSIFAGFFKSFDDGVSTSIRLSADRDGYGVTASMGRSLPKEPWDYGWRVSDTEGENSYRSASVSYRTDNMLLDGSLNHTGENLAINARVDGALVVAGGGLFLSHRIKDSFAIVDVGAPDIPVKLNNRLVGTTGSDGLVLVPGLQSYQNNRISIDPTNMPITASVSETTGSAIPALRAGVKVDFGVVIDARSAIVIFAYLDGSLVTAGTVGKILETGEEFIIGYDGRAFIEKLEATNTAIISHYENECTAGFAYRSIADNQIEIGPVACAFLGNSVQ